MSKIEVDKIDPQSGTALEIGTHMGHTTRVFSELFKKVITIKGTTKERIEQIKSNVAQYV